MYFDLYLYFSASSRYFNLEYLLRSFFYHINSVSSLCDLLFIHWILIAYIICYEKLFFLQIDLVFDIVLVLLMFSFCFYTLYIKLYTLLYITFDLIILFYVILTFLPGESYSLFIVGFCDFFLSFCEKMYIGIIFVKILRPMLRMHSSRNDLHVPCVPGKVL